MITHGGDGRGLTAPFWQHLLPYGEVRLDVGKRFALSAAAQAASACTA
ncbi:hypothetical protein [Nonomuraea sp. KM90]